jgi:PAS domain S-box-containing protein
VAGVEEEQARAAKVQNALYRIAELASAARDMQEFYRVIHEVVAELMYAHNFFITLYDEERQLANWAYYVDEAPAEEFVDTNKWYAIDKGQVRGMTAYVLRTEEPQLVPRTRLEELIARGEIELIGEPAESWLGVPLTSEERTVGVLAVQSYTPEHQYTEQDRDVLAFVGHHVGAALSRARAIEETRQRNAELAVINSVQAALAGELEMQAIYDVVGDKLQEIFDAQIVDIWTLDPASNLVYCQYSIERGERVSWEPYPLASLGFMRLVIETGEPMLIKEDLEETRERLGLQRLTDDEPQSSLNVPLLTGGEATGLIALQNMDREHAFDEADQRLLTTLAGSLSVALENARLVHETRQRNAELALINSVQSALAGELEMQAIYDVVGDKIQEIFDAQGTCIGFHDEATGLLSTPYLVERGERLHAEPAPLIGFSKHVLETGEPLLINENMVAEAERYGSTVFVGEPAKSILNVPLAIGGRANGLIALENFDREHAFSESDQRLLMTLAASLSVALENARLVHETRQRNAELALINSVQEALAGEFEMQAIYDVVGDKIQEIFDAQVVDIGIFDFAAGLLRFPYTIERGVRFPDDVLPIDFTHPTVRQLLDTKSAVLVPDVAARDRELGRASRVTEGTEPPQSMLFAPLVSGDEVRGRISLQNLDRTNAFTETDVRLLVTLAGSLSVALENARLVHETRQRNAELALINSVQDALAGELELQSIYGAVGDRIGEIFDVQSVSIAITDESTGNLEFPYAIELGTRHDYEIAGMAPFGFRKHVLETGESLRFNQDVEAEAERFGNPVLIGEMPKSVLFVPLAGGGRTTGVIDLQNINREQAFSDSDQQLLETLAGSLSVALENARLVHETRQRNAELALINSVQDAIAGELDPQAIYDAVGDKVQEIFDAQVVAIMTHDENTGLVHYPYIIERGERLRVEPEAPGGFSKYVIETLETVLVTENVAAEAERYGSDVIVGEAPKSVLFVPLVSSGRATGMISLQNLDREHAFRESDQQLLETLAGSLSVALENARLVHETRQRNAELALINGVQDAIAGELDPQAIYDAVGDKIREIFDAQVVSIRTIDGPTGLVHYPYINERGERPQVEPRPLTGFTKHVLESKQSLLIAENMDVESERYGSPIVPGTEDTKSLLFVPLVSSGKATGLIGLENIDREHAFGESDQQLLETLAGSLSVALENARLVHETRQRNAELALINGVQDAIAGELDPQAIYDAVGDKIQEIFDAQVVSIRTVDGPTGLVHYPYIIERGERIWAEPTVPIGFSKHVLESKESLLIVENMAVESERYGSPIVPGTEDAKSALYVPLVSSGKATGLIGLENIDREHAFGESDQQLLETLAGSLSVALENARLVHETRQRNAELALINGVQDAIAGELDPQAIYDAVGDRIRDMFDAQVVSITTLDVASGLVSYPYLIERGDRLQAEPRPLSGFTKHVLETREPLLLTENLDAESERYGSGVVAGETSKSVIFVPLVAGGKAEGVISLQNIDREHAFSEDDQRLLTTLAGSLAVALENARLVQETRQRVTELATVNSVGHALSSQLDPDALIELVGEHVRQTFDADIAYVALHDESAGQIEFAYYYESGQRRDEPSIAFGEGLTSRIVETREVLLLNREEHYEGEPGIGTPSRSYLGVPILVGSKAIGVISVQSIEEEGRFGEADTRLLATIAANVGVAIQNARLFTEVERQRGYLELLVAISPAAVIVMDVDERVTDWNPAAADLFGYSAEEATGRLIDELVFGSSRFATDEGQDITREALATGRAQRITRRRRRDGTFVDVEMMLVPLTVDGSHVGFLVMYHDVTELQRARQEAEAATQAKSAFLATMSHEIRTPMNAVIGMTDLLLGTELTGEQREFAEVVHSSGDALLHVIDDILDYSKIEAGKLDLEHEPFSLRDCVEGALDIVAPQAWEKELELGCLIDERAPAGIVGDGARLRQVLLNLLSNAVKFTERGEVFVLVNAEETREGSYEIELAVRDTGIGIPPDRMDRLFTSFSQVDTSTTRRFGGTGLGLAISKRLVELMGGTVSADSKQGKGSIFRISLPAVAADVPAKIALDEGLPHLSGRRILIVDDNATNREIVTRHAQSWGMEPVAVELPAAALQLIEQGEQFDVAVLDMMMPDMDGVALAREIRNRRSAEDLPLLLLTSVGRLSQGESSEVFSAQLAKPLKASQLYNALLNLLTAGEELEEGVAPVSDGKHVRSTLRILLAEDNAMNQKVALRLLERLGYRADVAGNGLEALAALERQPYDVVLMDMQMPELDGLDATRRICAQWPPEERPYIVAMTANALPEDREACFAAGMNDYVAKPIRSEELAAALKRVHPKSLATTANGPEAANVELDSEALGSLRELGGDDFLGEVIDAFLADAPELIATLRRSLDEESPEELRRAAHTLKSNGATLGAGEFAELCRNLEQRAKAGELDGAGQLVDRIEQEYRPLEEALASLRASAPS